MSESKTPTIPPYVKALSGSIGGIVEASCLQPIDVIKTRLQLDTSGTYKESSTVAPPFIVRKACEPYGRVDSFATHLTLKYTLRMGSNALFQSASRILRPDSSATRVGFFPTTAAEGLSPELLKYKGPIHCARTIIRAAPTVMRNGTNQAAMFTAKNAFDGILWKKQEGDGKGRAGGKLKYKGMVHAIRTIFAEEGLLYERRYIHNAPL
ncbi:hypothetical protein AAG906_022467 [Vitis piasezkii]